MEKTPHQQTHGSDVVSGVMLAGFGMFVLWQARHLEGFQSTSLGAGALPRAAAVLLIALGCLIAFRGFLRKQTVAAEQYPLRALVWLSAAVLFFAFAIRPAGLVLTSFGTICIAAFATSEVRWRQCVCIALVAAAGCAGLFVFLLKLPMALWPKL